MNPITAILLIKNNEKTIKRTLESLPKEINRILIGDIGSKDETTFICKKYGADVIRLTFKNDYSKARNELINLSQTNWNFHIEPWEFLPNVLPKIEMSIPVCYKIPCIQGDLMTKQVRLFNKKACDGFINPIYEYIKCKSSIDLDYPLISTPHKIEESEKIIEEWKSNYPLAIEPYYYQACDLLLNNKIKEFAKIAEYFLFNKKKSDMSVTLTKYYLSVVQCHVFEDQKEALKNLLYCLALKPLMAEFWCLLGDIYYKLKEYKKAKVFYENAMFLGMRRLKTDDWPVEISKYKLYPNKMIISCDNILNNSQTYSSLKL